MLSLRESRRDQVTALVKFSFMYFSVGARERRVLMRTMDKPNTDRETGSTGGLLSPGGCINGKTFNYNGKLGL
jgi:hypothetical protein